MDMSINALKKRLKSFLNNHPAIFNGTAWRDTNKRIRGFIKDKDLILDIGSLCAPFTKYLPNKTIVMDLPSTDRFGFSQERLNELKSNKNINQIFANGESLPFKDESFDKIICTEVIEHIYNDESAVSEMARVLRADGKAFLTTPNGDVIPLEQGIKEHVRHYSERDLQRILYKYFQEVEIEKRFRFYNLLNAQYRLGNAWGKNRSHIYLYFMMLTTSWMYDGVYLFEKVMGGGKRQYNFVAICSKSIRNR